jgi:hypothetical protein
MEKSVIIRRLPVRNKRTVQLDPIRVTDTSFGWPNASIFHRTLRVIVEDCDVEIAIDVGAIVEEYAAQAARNRSGHATALRGKIKAKVRQRVPVSDDTITRELPAHHEPITTEAAK